MQFSKTNYRHLCPTATGCIRKYKKKTKQFQKNQERQANLTTLADKQSDALFAITDKGMSHHLNQSADCSDPSLLGKE